MSHFSTALQEIITRSFEGNASNLGRATQLASSTVSRLLSGKFEPTLENLGNFGRSLTRTDRKQLLIAAARDRVPTEFQDELFGDEDPAAQLIRAKLSPDLAAVIRYLESSAMNDETTAQYLRKIGEWVGITTPSYGSLKVAETPATYNTPPARGKSSGSTNA